MDNTDDIKFKQFIDDKFLKYSSLKKGWSGESNSAPPSKLTLQYARLLIDIILNKSISKPIVSLSSDGSIDLYWKRGKHITLLDLSVYNDGTYSYYAKTNAGVEYFKDDVPIRQFANDDAIFTYL